jgi:hypothetical protein
MKDTDINYVINKKADKIILNYINNKRSFNSKKYNELRNIIITKNKIRNSVEYSNDIDRIIKTYISKPIEKTFDEDNGSLQYLFLNEHGCNYLDKLNSPISTFCKQYISEILVFIIIITNIITILRYKE